MHTQQIFLDTLYNLTFVCISGYNASILIHFFLIDSLKTEKQEFFDKIVEKVTKF